MIFFMENISIGNAFTKELILELYSAKVYFIKPVNINISDKVDIDINICQKPAFSLLNKKSFDCEGWVVIVAL